MKIKNIEKNIERFRKGLLLSHLLVTHLEINISEITKIDQKIKNLLGKELLNLEIINACLLDEYNENDKISS